MKILIDVCLSPDWVPFFATHGMEFIHWTTIGKCHGTDSVIFSYAHDNKFIIFTHDLDFGTLLAQTKSKSPSVIQARVQDPSHTKNEAIPANGVTAFGVVCNFSSSGPKSGLKLNVSFCAAEVVSVLFIPPLCISLPAQNDFFQSLVSG